MTAPSASILADHRPSQCRFRLQDEGKPYPRSSCQACGKGIMTGLGARCTVEPTPQPEAAPTPAPDWEARRWEAALAAMQGLLAGYYAETTRHNLGEVPEEATKIADALIAAMQEKKP